MPSLTRKHAEHHQNQPGPKTLLTRPQGPCNATHIIYDARNRLTPSRSQYADFAADVKASGCTTPGLRRRLAAAAFAKTSAYDAQIAACAGARRARWVVRKGVLGTQ